MGGQRCLHFFLKHILAVTDTILRITVTEQERKIKVKTTDKKAIIAGAHQPLWKLILRRGWDILWIITQCQCQVKKEFMKFLPKNTTYVLQHLDQGIIRSFKAHYKMALIQIWSQLETTSLKQWEGCFGVVMRWISEAREKVSGVTITNCFKKTGLLNKEALLFSRGSAEGELQVSKTTASVEEYLSADEIDLAYDCDEEDFGQEVHESTNINVYTTKMKTTWSKAIGQKWNTSRRNTCPYRRTKESNFSCNSPSTQAVLTGDNIWTSW